MTSSCSDDGSDSSLSSVCLDDMACEDVPLPSPNLFLDTIVAANATQNLDKIEWYRAALQQSPFVYSCHVGLISALRVAAKSGKAESIDAWSALRRAREAMAAMLTMEPQLWIDWVEDELETVGVPTTALKPNSNCIDGQSEYLWRDVDSSQASALYIALIVGLRGTVDYLSCQLWTVVLQLAAALGHALMDGQVSPYDIPSIPKPSLMLPRHLDSLLPTPSSLWCPCYVIQVGLALVGAHFAFGDRLWSFARAWEASNLHSRHQSSLSPSSWDCVNALYCQQLSIPSAQWTTVHKQYVEWYHTTNPNQPPSKDPSTLTIRGVEERMAIEVELQESLIAAAVDGGGSGSAMGSGIPTPRQRHAWMQYIALEKKDKKLFDISRDNNSPIFAHHFNRHHRTLLIMERAMSEGCFLDVQMWREYVEYIMDHCSQVAPIHLLSVDYSAAMVLWSVCHRAVRNIPWDSTMWSLWIHATHRCCSILESWRLIRFILSMALCISQDAIPATIPPPLIANTASTSSSDGTVVYGVCAVTTASDTVDILVTYISYIRRWVRPYLDETQSANVGREGVTEAMDWALSYMAEHRGGSEGVLSGDPWCQLLRLKAGWEAENRMGDDCLETWQRIMTLDNGYLKIHPSIWLQMINDLVKSGIGCSSIRETYTSCLSALLAVGTREAAFGATIMGESWLWWERSSLTCNDQEWRRCQQVIGHARSNMTLILSSVKPSKKAAKGIEPAPSGSPAAPSLKRKRPDQPIRDVTDHSKKRAIGGGVTVSKTFQEFGCELFVSRLSHSVDDEVLRNAFPECTSARVVRKLTSDGCQGISKGFGFVAFANKELARRALITLDGSQLHGVSINVKMANGMNDTAGDDGVAGDTLFVFNIAVPKHSNEQVVESQMRSEINNAILVLLNRAKEIDIRSDWTPVITSMELLRRPNGSFKGFCNVGVGCSKAVDAVLRVAADDLPVIRGRRLGVSKTRLEKLNNKQQPKHVINEHHNPSQSAIKEDSVQNSDKKIDKSLLVSGRRRLLMVPSSVYRRVEVPSTVENTKEGQGGSKETPIGSTKLSNSDFTSFLLKK